MRADPQPLTRLVEARATRTPHAVAVEAVDRRLTFAELEGAADELANALAARGVTSESLVAVLMRRSCDLIVALLAVLKAGGAYIPLDERAPQARMAAVLAETGARVLLVDAANRNHPMTLAGVDVIEAQAPPPTRQRPDGVRSMDQLAYVMHTSGSTGRPKGVAATHRGIAELVLDLCWDLRPEDRVLFLSPHAFDASTYEIWAPLVAGARVFVAPPGAVDSRALRSLVTEYGVTCLHLTAGLFRVVAGEDPACLAGVREVLTGGDVVSPAAVRRILQACPGVRVRHLYGPTEITLCATQDLMTGLDEVDNGRLPIGAPLTGTRVHILDDALRQVLDGATGELYLAGDGLARGYLARPDLTAERFVADPYGPIGSRMYRTGDLARRRPDGALDFLGRADRQIKIRGFRVELSEIELALAGHPAVGQAVAVAGDASAGRRRVVAYVTAAGNSQVRLNELGEHLAQRLPDYMLPADIVVLDRLPLTPNGKVDMQALPTLWTGGRETTTPSARSANG